MNQILIKVHSFTDSLSNSSSETFISCSNQTVSTIRQIIDNVLAISGSNKTTDDYFTLDLVTEITDFDYDEVEGKDNRKVSKFIKSLGVSISKYGECSLTTDQIKEVQKFIEKNELDSDFDSKVDDSSDYPPTVNIQMTIKEGLVGEELKAAQKVMSAVNGLMGTISAESRYC